MSVKSVIKPYQVLTNGDMTGNVSTLVSDVESSDNVAYQVVWTGNAVGTFAVEGTVNGIDWEELDLGTPGPEAASVADSFLVSLKGVPYSKLKLTYSATSGSGSLNVWIMAKRTGG